MAVDEERWPDDSLRKKIIRFCDEKTFKVIQTLNFNAILLFKQIKM